LERIDTVYRLDQVAEMIVREGFSHDALIVDFGGGPGYLARRLKNIGYKRVESVEVGEEIPEGIDLLVSTQVFEHILYLHNLINDLSRSMATGGKFLIEVPDAHRIATITPSPIQDYHQKHVNHFGPSQLDLLFSMHGYERLISEQPIARMYGGAPLYRALYGRDLSLLAYQNSRNHIEGHMKAILSAAQKVRGPVIIWGCGDIAMLVLAERKFNVKYFVDLDPAYEGVTIGGVPVVSQVTSREPIVIAAQNQKESILNSIKEAGLENEVIVLTDQEDWKA